jgi:ADP-ribosylglycohydrolase
MLAGISAGAFYGEQGIPQSWRDKLAHSDLIAGFAEQLFSLARPN